MKVYLLFKHTDAFDSDGQVVSAFQSKKDAHEKMDKLAKAEQKRVILNQVDEDDYMSYRIQEVDLVPSSRVHNKENVSREGNVYFLGKNQAQ